MGKWTLECYIHPYLHVEAGWSYHTMFHEEDKINGSLAGNIILYQEGLDRICQGEPCSILPHRLFELCVLGLQLNLYS